MKRVLVAIAFSVFLFSGCTSSDPDGAEATPIVAPDFDGLSQDCFDATVRIRSRNSTGSASAIKYLNEKENGFAIVDSVLQATHVEFETNKHVAGTNGTPHVVDVWYEGELVASANCKTNKSWFESGVSKDIATIIVSLETLGGAMPIVSAAPYGKVKLKEGEKIFTVGCSSGRVPRARCGSVVKQESGLIYYLPQSIAGDSGSAVFRYSREREQWETIGRTAWAIQIGKQWMGLAMTADRVDDIRSGRVSANDFNLPDGAVPIAEIGGRLPVGAIACDELTPVTMQSQDAMPVPMDVGRHTGRWRFPILKKDIREKPERQSRVREWNIFGGISDFFRSLLRFAFTTAIILLVISLYVAPTILTPLKYDWPIQFVKKIIASLSKVKK